jgi:hypothetical protein
MRGERAAGASLLSEGQGRSSRFARGDIPELTLWSGTDFSVACIGKHQRPGTGNLAHEQGARRTRVRSRRMSVGRGDDAHRRGDHACPVVDSVPRGDCVPSGRFQTSSLLPHRNRRSSTSRKPPSEAPGDALARQRDSPEGLDPGLEPTGRPQTKRCASRNER